MTFLKWLFSSRDRASPEPSPDTQSQTDESDWVDIWAGYVRSVEVEATLKRADQLFSSETVSASLDKWHLFEYEFNGRRFEAILKEADQAGEPVQAQETEQGWLARIQVDPLVPERHRFVYCTCGQPH
jgi:hypothetical protein